MPQPPPLSADPRIGETLVGRYRLDKLVGKGGMGRVYRATQFPLNRPVAVKILSPEFQKKDPQFVKRFFLEAASAARLTHPNTITVFDYGEAESTELFIVMEYLHGMPLSKVIATEGPLAPERVLHVGMQICRALREAHTKGIIHRDLKPGNIMLLEEGDDADFVKVLDFGLVKLFNPNDHGAIDGDDPLTPEPPDVELTKAGMFLGSPKYMSPEQIQGISLDPRTDIYSLGVLMFQMACAKPPFTGATSVEVIYKHVNHPVPSLAEMGVNVPAELEDLIRRMLAKRREDRFESMGALLARMKDVRRLLTGISASSETGIEIDLSDLGNLQQQRIITQSLPAVDPSPSTSQSMRPQTHPKVSTPPRASGTPSGSMAAVREAPFVEVHTEDTGSEALPRSPQTAKHTTLTRFAPAVAGAALVCVLAGVGYVYWASPKPEAESESDSELGLPVVPSVRVAFVSEPAGAEVFEHGVSLGVTPFSLDLPADRAGAPVREFLFKKAGFADEIRTTAVQGTGLELKVSLRAVGSPPPEDPGRGVGDKSDPDYKENPY